MCGPQGEDGQGHDSPISEYGLETSPATTSTVSSPGAACPVMHGAGIRWRTTITASGITSDGSATVPTIRIGTQVRSLR